MFSLKLNFVADEIKCSVDFANSIVKIKPEFQINLNVETSGYTLVANVVSKNVVFFMFQ